MFSHSIVISRHATDLHVKQVKSNQGSASFIEATIPADISHGGPGSYGSQNGAQSISKTSFGPYGSVFDGVSKAVTYSKELYENVYEHIHDYGVSGEGVVSREEEVSKTTEVSSTDVSNIIIVGESGVKSNLLLHEQDGLFWKIAKELFRNKFSVWIEYLEIGQIGSGVTDVGSGQLVVNLLDGSDGDVEKNSKQGRGAGKGVVGKTSTMSPATSLADLKKLITIAQQRRILGETTFSSTKRRTQIISLIVSSTGGATSFRRLRFVDVAGVDNDVDQGSCSPVDIIAQVFGEVVEGRFSGKNTKSNYLAKIVAEGFGKGRGTHAISVFSKAVHAPSVAHFADLCAKLSQSTLPSPKTSPKTSPISNSSNNGSSTSPLLPIILPIPKPVLSEQLCSSIEVQENPSHIYMRNLHSDNILSSQLRVNVTAAGAAEGAGGGLLIGSCPLSNDLMLAGLPELLYRVRVKGDEGLECEGTTEGSDVTQKVIELIPMEQDSNRFLRVNGMIVRSQQGGEVVHVNVGDQIQLGETYTFEFYFGTTSGRDVIQRAAAADDPQGLSDKIELLNLMRGRMGGEEIYEIERLERSNAVRIVVSNVSSDILNDNETLSQEEFISRYYALCDGFYYSENFEKNVTKFGVRNNGKTKNGMNKNGVSSKTSGSSGKKTKSSPVTVTDRVGKTDNKSANKSSKISPTSSSHTKSNSKKKAINSNTAENTAERIRSSSKKNAPSPSDGGISDLKPPRLGGSADKGAGTVKNTNSKNSKNNSKNKNYGGNDNKSGMKALSSSPADAGGADAADAGGCGVSPDKRQHCSPVDRGTGRLSRISAVEYSQSPGSVLSGLRDRRGVTPQNAGGEEDSRDEDLSLVHLNFDAEMEGGDDEKFRDPPQPTSVPRAVGLLRAGGQLGQLGQPVGSNLLNKGVLNKNNLNNSVAQPGTNKNQLPAGSMLTSPRYAPNLIAPKIGFASQPQPQKMAQMQSTTIGNMFPRNNLLPHNMGGAMTGAPITASARVASPNAENLSSLFNPSSIGQYTKHTATATSGAFSDSETTEVLAERLAEKDAERGFVEAREAEMREGSIGTGGVNSVSVGGLNRGRVNQHHQGGIIGSANPLGGINGFRVGLPAFSGNNLPNRNIPNSARNNYKIASPLYGMNGNNPNVNNTSFLSMGSMGSMGSVGPGGRGLSLREEGRGEERERIHSESSATTEGVQAVQGAAMIAEREGMVNPVNPVGVNPVVIGNKNKTNSSSGGLPMRTGVVGPSGSIPMKKSPISRTSPNQSSNLSSKNKPSPLKMKASPKGRGKASGAAAPRARQSPKQPAPTATERQIGASSAALRKSPPLRSPVRDRSGAPLRGSPGGVQPRRSSPPHAVRNVNVNNNKNANSNSGNKKQSGGENINVDTDINREEQVPSVDNVVHHENLSAESAHGVVKDDVAGDETNLNAAESGGEPKTGSNQTQEPIAQIPNTNTTNKRAYSPNLGLPRTVPQMTSGGRWSSRLRSLKDTFLRTGSAQRSCPAGRKPALPREAISPPRNHFEQTVQIVRTSSASRMRVRDFFFRGGG